MTRQHSPFLASAISYNYPRNMLEETSPLLGGQRKVTRWSSIYWLSAVIFCLSAAGALLNVPLTQLIENNLCSRYAEGAPTKELCKTDKIQSKLAYLNGYLPLVEAVVGTDHAWLSALASSYPMLTGCYRSYCGVSIWSFS